MQNAPTPSNPYASYMSATSPAFSPPPGASPAAMTPAAHRPTPVNANAKPVMQQAQQPPAGPTSRSNRAASVASRTRTGATAPGMSVEDPLVEARKALALLMGTGAAGTGGLLDKLETEYDTVMDKRDHAYDLGHPSLAKPTTLEDLMSTMDNVTRLLQSSALGGFPAPTGPDSDLTMQQRIDAASITVQRLFRDRQRAKEGAEIAGSVLGSSS